MAEAAKRYEVLDGWRGVSILFVLAAHLLPIGPRSWQLNATFGPLGMALFFTLSGFLITNFLLHRPSVTDFLIRRLARIVPLAWLCLATVLLWTSASSEQWAANLMFYANWPPMRLTASAGHLWSLCVEMQFYLGVALLFLVWRERGLLLLPLLCVAVTLLRVADEAHAAINTYYRVDEILAGCVLALAFNRRLGGEVWQALGKLNPYPVLVLFAISCHPESGALNYARPYLAAALVGCTIFNGESSLARLLVHRKLAYIAAISYALYVLHPLLGHTWLGSGEAWEKYAKRPILFVALFLLAHLSTFHFEHRCIAYAKNLSARLRRPPTGSAGK